jgi:hypothetical protein
MKKKKKKKSFKTRKAARDCHAQASEADVEEEGRAIVLLSTGEKHISNRVAYSKKYWENLQEVQG